MTDAAWKGPRSTEKPTLNRVKPLSSTVNKLTWRLEKVAQPYSVFFFKFLYYWQRVMASCKYESKKEKMIFWHFQRTPRGEKNTNKKVLESLKSQWVCRKVPQISYELSNHLRLLMAQSRTNWSDTSPVTGSHNHGASKGLKKQT